MMKFSLSTRCFGWPAAGLVTCHTRFDAWRTAYNHERPHEALGMALPASRYVPGPRPYPEELESFEYGPGAITRIVQANGAGCTIWVVAIG